jgi:hypothetical protein
MIRIRTNVHPFAIPKSVFKRYIGLFVGWLLVTIVVLVALIAAFIQHTSNRTFIVISPVAYQMFQRDWKSNTANIPIIVDAVGFDDSIALQAKWQDNAWIPIQLSRVEQGCAGGTMKMIAAHQGEPCFRYVGKLTSRSSGQATLSVHLDDWETHLFNANAEATVDYVGIGDVFLLGGQSNSVGDADNFQPYHSNQYVATLFSRSGQWALLDDKILTDQGPIAKDAPIKGSPWPVLGTLITQYTHAPVAFIPTGIGSQPISQWDAKGSLYKFMVEQTRFAGTQPAMVLWIQGESDALAKMSTSDYQKALSDLVQRVYSDLHIRMMIANLGILKRPQITDADVERIRQAIESVWADNSLVYRGPSLADIPLKANPHFTTDEEVKQFAQRWFDSLVAAGLPAHN